MPTIELTLHAVCVYLVYFLMAINLLTWSLWNRFVLSFENYNGACYFHISIVTLYRNEWQWLTDCKTLSAAAALRTVPVEFSGGLTNTRFTAATMIYATAPSNLAPSCLTSSSLLLWHFCVLWQFSCVASWCLIHFECQPWPNSTKTRYRELNASCQMFMEQLR